MLLLGALTPPQAQQDNLKVIDFCLVIRAPEGPPLLKSPCQIFIFGNVSPCLNIWKSPKPTPVEEMLSDLPMANERHADLKTVWYRLAANILTFAFLETASTSAKARIASLSSGAAVARASSRTPPPPDSRKRCCSCWVARPRMRRCSSVMAICRAERLLMPWIRFAWVCWRGMAEIGKTLALIHYRAPAI